MCSSPSPSDQARPAVSDVPGYAQILPLQRLGVRTGLTRSEQIFSKRFRSCAGSITPVSFD